VTRVPLGVLDLVPVVSGSGPAAALRNTVDLAQRTEAAGYRRYWFAEHHLNPGVAGSSPAVMIALVAPATSRIRLGSGGVQSGHRTALAIVEEFGLIDALYPGRLDLGLGRSGGRKFLEERLAGAKAPSPKTKRPPRQAHVVAGGLLVPAPPPMRNLGGSARVRLGFEMLQQEGAESPGYAELLGDIVGLLRGTYRSAEGLNPHPVPGERADVELWVLGSSGGESASVAGALGIRFAGSYHITPATALEGIEAYRAAFVSSAELAQPYVAVSADVVVGPDDKTAHALAAGYGLWVLGIRRGDGACPFPSPAEAAAHEWTDEDRALVADRIDTQIVGSPSTVAAKLDQLQSATDADELVITTITHDHCDRARSYELLAEEWSK
jgi:alkanesulfonate monooxygenase SsuD/methylene tetrahydromethanopterin reductase-like flavin-dependent oxidoreductase (luciferase family)